HRQRDTQTRAHTHTHTHVHTHTHTHTHRCSRLSFCSCRDIRGKWCSGSATSPNQNHKREIGWSQNGCQHRRLFFCLLVSPNAHQLGGGGGKKKLFVPWEFGGGKLHKQKGAVPLVV